MTFMVIGCSLGQTEHVLLKNIQDIAGDPVMLSPDDQRSEFANTRWLSATAQERSTLSVSQVVSALLETARALQRQVMAAGFHGTATFYVWHDEQAGQLRCSVNSRPPDNLPFGGSYRPTDDLGAIVASFLSDDTPGVVAWEDLEPVGKLDPPDRSCLPFIVWTFDLSCES